MNNQKIESEVDFVVNHNGLTISSKRFDTARFVPFDIKGKCKTCQSNAVPLDVVITKEGLTMMCPRFKEEKYLQFDEPYVMPRKAYFRVKTHSTMFTIPSINNEEDIQKQDV
jgi:hypothetical protein